MGAAVVAIDVDDRAPRRPVAARRQLALRADAGLQGAPGRGPGLRGRAKIPTWRRSSIFETSGTAAGSRPRSGSWVHGGYLSVVGYTPDKVELRLSNLMAFDATAQGNWACLPEHYPAVVDLVLSGRVALTPFIERRPLSAINETFEELHASRARSADRAHSRERPRRWNSRTTTSFAPLLRRRSLRRSLPLRSPDGTLVDGLHAVRITLDNPKQLNSYTTEMVKGVILGMRRASNDRACVAVVFTGAGRRAPSAPAATPRSTPSTTPAAPRSTGSTCGSSTTW
jgi:hypothetical protein